MPGEIYFDRRELAFVKNSNSYKGQAGKIHESSGLCIKIINLEAATTQLSLIVSTQGYRATWPEPLIFQKQKIQILVEMLLKNVNSYFEMVCRLNKTCLWAR